MGPFGRGGDARGARRQPHFQFMERLLPLIARDHPDLAERLTRLRESSPEEFERVLADALAIRFEEAHERHTQESVPSERGTRPPGRPPGPRWDKPEAREQQASFEREMHELQRRNEELEQRSAELVRRYRELRGRPEESREERDAVRRRIEEAVEEHFNVRTELRSHELRRVELELDHLREMVERIRGDVERREQARGSIIERRLQQLLGQEASDW